MRIAPTRSSISFVLGAACLSLFLLAGTALQAQTPAPLRATRPDARPADGAPAGLEVGDAAQLDAFISASMQAKHVPGLSAVIIKDGETYWSGAFGTADPYLGLPVDESTLFMLASISKTVTGAALLQLVDEQLVGLDDPASDHLPFSVVHPVFPGTDITVRMLLTHSAGLRDNWGVMPYYAGDPTYPLQDYMRDYLTPGGALYDATKNFQAWEPGSDSAYCNNGLALVGLIVEHVSGVPFPDRSEDRLFTPLGMHESAWFLADLDPAHVAMPCAWNGSTWVPYGHYGYADYPSGQLRTSAPQLARFLTMVMQDGQYAGTTILSQESAQALTTPQDPVLDPTQGLVFYTWKISGRTVWGHGGGDQGVTTEMWFDPVTDIGVVALTNGESYIPDIIDAMFDHAEVYPPQESLTTDVSEISAGAGGLVRFTIRGGTINADRTYLLLGSLSGSSPGTPLPGGYVTLPLNWDLATDVIVSAIDSPMFFGFYSQLAPSGIGRATWKTFGPLPPALVGATLTFAGAFKSPWDYVTNPVEIAITP
ncbi:MAG: serine hydrolase domain-containing protein [Planctomycetota bacterium]|jgi:CubicO group peptidase (beta-lactamase class C family)